jgi:hypothetical protein
MVQIDCRESVELRYISHKLIVKIYIINTLNQQCIIPHVAQIINTNGD